MSGDYMALADEFAAQIKTGSLKAGDRLPPQRQFAYARNIAVSTASRVYSELLRRGLVVGEVGRGTFVSGDAARSGHGVGGRRAARLAHRPRVQLSDPAGAGGADDEEPRRARPRRCTAGGAAAVHQRRHRARAAVAAEFLAVEGWSPRPGQLVFTGNGRQSIAAVLAALVPTGGRCGIEAITYPFAKGVAAQLGITLVPLAMDEHGVRPDAVQKAHREGKLSAIYVQPVIHNPLGMTMPQQRRTDLLRVAEKLDLVVVEDYIYGFLDDDAAARGGSARALRGDRQPLQAHCAGPVARLHRRAHSICARASSPRCVPAAGSRRALPSPPPSG